LNNKGTTTKPMVVKLPHHAAAKKNFSRAMLQALAQKVASNV